MRHGRLTAALTALAVTGLAAAQPAALSRPVPADGEAPAARIRLSSNDLPPPPPKALPKAAKGTLKTGPAPRVVGEVPAAPPAATAEPAEPAGPKFAEDQAPSDPAPPAAGDKEKDKADKAAESVLPAPGSPVIVADPVYSEGMVGGPAAGPQAWVSAEYLAWRIRKDAVPPLVATGPAQFPVGFLTNPATTVLFGGELSGQTFSGARLRAGCWLDACQTIGVEVGGFWLCPQTDRTTFYSDQFPVLTRPFTDVNPLGANAQFLAFPGIASGDITVENKTQLYGGTAAVRCPVCFGGCCCQNRLDLLVGAQCLKLEEEISITETPRFAPDAPFPGLGGVQFIGQDKFQTRNTFYGGVVGFDAQLWKGPCFINVVGSIGIGCNEQRVEVSGYQQTITPGGAVAVVPGGLLAVPGANIGTETRNQFSLVPQIGVNLGYQVSCCCQVFAGYNLLCWTNVVRPGAQIDPFLDINRIPNFGGGAPASVNRPVIPFEQQTFWAQGISAGIRLAW